MGNGISVGEVVVRGKRRWVVNIGSGLGRRRRFFPTAKAANEFAGVRGDELADYGGIILALTAAQRASLAESLKRLEEEGEGATLLEAVDFFLSHRKALQRVTVAAAAAEFLQAKRISGRRLRYLQTLKSRLTAFSVGRSARYIHTMTTADVETFLAGQQIATSTRRGMIIDLRTFFSFCAARGYCSGNPARGVDLPLVDESAPKPLSVPQVANLLRGALYGVTAAQSLSGKPYEPDLDVLRWAVVQVFGFLRSSEASRITESEIRDDVIEVTGAAAKKRHRRLVEVNETLRAWLAVGGRLPVKNLRRRVSALRLAVFGKGNWPGNALRDTCCTYAFPVLGAKASALQSGHSEDMLLNRYREVTTRASADKFWALRPTALDHK